MISDQDIITSTQQALHVQSQAIAELIPRINFEFVAAVECILQISGRVIVTGMGKPGYIARKLAATLMSTGTPAIYLHPAEAIHGDLGMITSSDIIIAISNSGETAEIVNLLPTISKIGIPLIAICGNRSSALGCFSQYYLDAKVNHEICPLNLAPTTSIAAQLALADVLAVAIMRLKKFTRQDFAFYHPGGNLGKVHLLTVKKLLEKTRKNPQISIDKSISDSLFVMTESGTGAVCVVNENHKLLGIITDGDIRRHLKMSGNDLLDTPIQDIMTANPIVIYEQKYVSDALLLMQEHQPNPITVLPVINDHQVVIGLIHLTDLLTLNHQSIL